MTQNNSRSVHSVWTLTVEPVSTSSDVKVELQAEAIKKITAEIESRAVSQVRSGQSALHVEALRTLYA